jgi:glutaredoxin
LPYKGYDINQIKGNMPKLLSILNENANLINFDKNHRTKPIIFYNGKFIGGYQQLAEKLNNIS